MGRSGERKRKYVKTEEQKLLLQCPNVARKPRNINYSLSHSATTSSSSSSHYHFLKYLAPPNLERSRKCCLATTELGAVVTVHLNASSLNKQQAWARETGGAGCGANVRGDLLQDFFGVPLSCLLSPVLCHTHQTGGPWQHITPAPLPAPPPRVQHTQGERRQQLQCTNTHML